MIDRSYRKSGFSSFDCLRNVTTEHIDFLSGDVPITRSVQLEAEDYLPVIFEGISLLA